MRNLVQLRHLKLYSRRQHWQRLHSKLLSDIRLLLSPGLRSPRGEERRSCNPYCDTIETSDDTAYNAAEQLTTEAQ